MDLSNVHKKRIWLIRHGEAQHNVFFKNGDRVSGAGLLDPALTEKGIEEAKSTAKHPLLPLSEADLIVSSPLKRTVQTALMLLQSTGATVEAKPVLLHPDIQETGDVNCDTGQPHSHLIEQLKTTPLFESFDLSICDASELSRIPNWHVKEGTYAHEGSALSSRLARFTRWLIERPEEKIVIVGHHNVFLLLTKLSFLNCEVREFGLSVEDAQVVDNDESLLRAWNPVHPKRCDTYSELSEKEKEHIEVHAPYCSMRLKQWGFAEPERYR